VVAGFEFRVSRSRKPVTRNPQPTNHNRYKENRVNLIPHRIPSLLTKLFPKLIWRIPTNEKIIYLTFDDGPIPGTTEFVLDTLRSFHAQATFFCIGDNIKKFPNVFKKIIADGHEVGNHTFNHLKGWSTTLDLYVDNVKKCEMQFSLENFQSANLFRPPYGRITPKQIKALREYQIVMWDVLSHDYQQHGVDEDYLKGTIKATRPGSIVVFHDSLKADKKIRFMLPRYVAHFTGLGFQFKTLRSKTNPD
jgi:peptidoglycan-N-acetylglucosamine deacetylase